MQRKREIFSPIHLNSIFIEFSWFHYIIQAIIGLADSSWLLQSYDTSSRTHSYAYLSIKCTISTLLKRKWKPLRLFELNGEDVAAKAKLKRWRRRVDKESNKSYEYSILFYFFIFNFLIIFSSPYLCRFENDWEINEHIQSFIYDSVICVLVIP